MSAISTTVYKDNSGYKSAGYPKTLNSPISVLGLESVTQYPEDIDMIGCASANPQPSTILLKVSTPDTGVLWIDETEESLFAKLRGVCCTADKVGIINDDILSQSNTYQNDDLENVGQNDFIAFLGGGQIFPTINSTTGTLDNTAFGGFSPGHISIVYGKGIATSMGAGTSLLPWVLVNNSITLPSASKKIFADATAGDVTISLPVSPIGNIDIKVYRSDSSGNILTVFGTINQVPNTSKTIDVHEVFTFSWDTTHSTYILY